MTPWRFYRQRSTAVAVRLAYPVCLAGAVGCGVGAIEFDNPAPGLALVFVTLFLAVIVWGELRGVKQGIHESDTGLTCVTMYGARLVGWREVATFEHRQTGTWDRVFARGHDGRARVLPSVLQGQRIVWSDGETRDIVGILNGRLADWRLLHPERSDVRCA
jgi:hypothetical protein